MRLFECPHVRVRVRCIHYKTPRGDYSLARLAHRFGPDAELAHVLLKIVVPTCGYAMPPGYRYRKREPKCGAYLVDVEDGPAWVVKVI